MTNCLSSKSLKQNLKMMYTQLGIQVCTCFDINLYRRVNKAWFEISLKLKQYIGQANTMVLGLYTGSSLYCSCTIYVQVLLLLF